MSALRDSLGSVEGGEAGGAGVPPNAMALLMPHGVEYLPLPRVRRLGEEDAHSTPALDFFNSSHHVF